MDKVFLLMRSEHGDKDVVSAHSTWRGADNALITEEQMAEQQGVTCYSFYIEELEVQP